MSKFILVSEKNGAEVKIGDTVTSFRDEKAKVLSFIPPRHAGSTGRIVVRFKGDSLKCEDAYYPSVFDCAIKEVRS